MPDLGDLKYLFNRTYVWTDPQYVNGLGIWRDVNVPPLATDVFGLFAVAPIVDSFDKDTETTTLSFDVNILEDVNGIDNRTSYIKGMLEQLRRPATSGSPISGLPDIRASLPMVSVKSTRAVAIGFDIIDLPYVEIEPPKKFTVKTNTYNGNNPVNIKATVPIVETSSGDIVDLSFDITALDYA